MKFAVVGARLACLMGMALLAGCTQDARSLSLDEGLARASLAEFLETWKSGGKAEDLKPRITGFDMAWNSGRELVSYEILPEAKSDGANLHVKVAAVLKDAQGKENKTEIPYIVGTQPVITIFRP